MINKAVKKHDSDRYVKHFNCKDHMFTMFFCCLEKCNSLREVAGGRIGLSGKEETVRINDLHKKNTLLDTNKGRKVEFFDNLLKKYSFVLSDSRIEIVIREQFQNS